MKAQFLSPTIFVVFLGGLTTGCGNPPAFFVETTVHSDGSCDRTILQPKGDCLPDFALKPAWNRQWKSVVDMPDPREKSRGILRNEALNYFKAVGSFRGPAAIPAHYRFANQELPEAGASELVRNYERKDYGFVVEHRWSEKITNIVTFAGFLKARDELLTMFEPMVVEWLTDTLGKDYDGTKLIAYLKTDVRQFVEEVSLILFEAASRHEKIANEDPVNEKLYTDVAVIAKRRIGLDLLDRDGKLVSSQEADRRRLPVFVRDLLIKYVQHRDGRPLLGAEADALIGHLLDQMNNKNNVTVYALTKRSLEQTKNSNDVVKPNAKEEKAFEKKAWALMTQITGLYNVPFSSSFSGSFQYEFVVRMPGEVVDTNATSRKDQRLLWKFDSDQLFPDGYEMNARSIAVDIDAQKKALGHVAIDTRTKALEFIAIVGAEGPLLEAVRAVGRGGDPQALTRIKTRTSGESKRAADLARMLLKP